MAELEELLADAIKDNAPPRSRLGAWLRRRGLLRLPSPGAAAGPPIVALCGSTRFWEQLAEANLYETAAGRIVLAPGCNLKQPHPLWAHPARVDRLSTRSEIDYARQSGKPLRFTHPEAGPDREGA
ncbi:hypothetical protein ACFVWX_23060 [Streptomyces sp. NPDC058220]|uniref:hypothetical protein n=1 Tax=unclassified Streptomyces TaxID=2593676 RepID=UPI0036ED8C93